MEYGFLSRAGKFLQEQRKHRRWMMMFLCLAGGVTLGTLAFLKLYGQAMTHQVKMLDCQYEVHVHTEDCYEENEDGDEVLVCEYADYAEYVIHVHNDDCYDQKGNLVCPLEEHELHEHDDDCWEEEDVLICGEEEAEGSTERSESETKAAETVAVSDDSQDAKEESGSDAGTDKELACEKEEHKHDDSCYDGGSGCDLEEHTHNDGCYDKTETLVCEESEHTHDDGCYSEVRGERNCGESEHEHDDGCYDEDGEFDCDKDEHSHDDGCYEVTEERTCGKDEHTHGGGCYEVTENLTCEIKEHEHDDSCEADSELTCKIEEHEHDDSCYVETKAETEKKETSRSAKEDVQEEVKETNDSKEAEEGHTHTDDCYETEEVMTCGELELHIHDDSCYDEDCFDEDGNLIEGSRVSCGLLQLEEHVHTEECFKIVELTPEEIAALNGGATLHVHSDECYDEDGNLICGHEVTHLHQLDCYDEDGNLICGFGVKEETHEHDANCYDEEGNLTCGFEDAKDHEHDANCYDEDGNLICGYETEKVHEHDLTCYDEEGNLICGYETDRFHEHDETCYDEDGNLICGYVTEEKEYENAKVYEGENYIVTVRYDDDAEIPEEAELIVEEITSESHEEHYAQREEEFRQVMDSEDAAIRALLKIGFYLDEAEVEPMSEVSVTVQFLDEDGLAEGRPITVVHFAEEGTEKLNGGNAKDSSTTFKLKSFSEIAIGYGQEEQIDNVNEIEQFYMSESFQYEDDAFHITFHVEGVAAVVADKTDKVVSSVDGDEPVQTETEDTAESEEMDEESVSSEPAEKESALPADADTIEEDDTVLPADMVDEDNTELPSDADGTEEPVSSEMRDDAEVKEEIAAPENTEDESSASPAEDITGLDDGAAIDQVVLEGDDGEDRKLSFTVKLLRTDSEEYDAVRSYAERADEENESELFLVRVMSYALTCNGKKVDLSNCKVTAEVTPVETLFEATDVSFEKFAEESNEISEEVSEEENDEEDEKSSEEENDAEIPETTDVQVEGDSDEDSSKMIADESKENSENEGESGSDEVDPASVAATFSLAPSAIVEEGLDTANMFQANVMMMAVELADDRQINELNVMDLGSDSEVEEYSPMLLTLNTGVVALAATEYTTNPSFTVEYYANLKVVDTSTTGNALDLIDTSVAGNGTDIAVLPKNGVPLKTKNIYLDGNGYVKTKIVPWEIYEEREQKYFSAPTLAYMNILADTDANYVLSEVWKSDAEGSKVDDDGNRWIVYKDGDSDTAHDLTGIVFTNRSETAAKSSSYILIEEGTKIRLVYEQKEKTYNNPTTFYDYDITDGRLFRAQYKSTYSIWTYSDQQYGSVGETKNLKNPITYYKDSGSTRETHNGTILDWAVLNSGKKQIYAYTIEQGINSAENYNGKTESKLAFGNANTGTGLGNRTWNGIYVNRHNGSTTKYGSAGCAFELVTGLVDGKIQYSEGINAPNLFNDGAAVGKTQIDDYSLDFRQEGDTYTLTTVKTETGSAASGGLDRFNNPTNSIKTHTNLWTNNFWPMDSARTWGTFSDGRYHDLKFGSSIGYGKFNVDNAQWKFGPIADNGESAINMRFPESDDGQNHNSYFGMNFSLNFTFTEDYLGPLEYYFFGDDDMWVFLDNELVCDIGGTHSSVGEYVDLWDYLDRKTDAGKQHTLSFFYTERGASGSTCWMQFTLPSVSHTETSGSGSLDDRVTVGKLVQGEDTEQEFEFKLFLKNSDGTPCVDNYPYIRYYASGTAYEDAYMIADGGIFKLKAGERIGFKYLPNGVTFTVEEVPSDGYTIGTVIDGSPGTSGTIEVNTGASPEVTHNVMFVNTEVSEYDLPKTGGQGTDPYTMAGALLMAFSVSLLYKRKFRERRG